MRAFERSLSTHSVSTPIQLILERLMVVSEVEKMHIRHHTSATNKTELNDLQEIVGQELDMTEDKNRASSLTRK